MRASVPHSVHEREPPGEAPGRGGRVLVAAELSLKGWLATVTIKNAPLIDVLAHRPGSGRSLAIQTKTASYGNQFRQRSPATSTRKGVRDGDLRQPVRSGFLPTGTGGSRGSALQASSANSTAASGASARPSAHAPSYAAGSRDWRPSASTTAFSRAPRLPGAKVQK